jgi:hypothetical protein
MPPTTIAIRIGGGGLVSKIENKLFTKLQTKTHYNVILTHIGIIR